jgi:hypothetical protein
MTLTVAERKHLMPHGAQGEVAEAERVAESYVSAVMAGEVRPKTERSRLKLRRVQRALARKLGRTIADAFPESQPAVEQAVA